MPPSVPARHGRVADEPLGVGRVGGVEHPLAVVVEHPGAAVVEGRRGHQSDPGVAVLVVVVVEEIGVSGRLSGSLGA